MISCYVSAVVEYDLAGRYLNLPVVEADGHLVAIVDVLKLTYATLEQVSSIVLKCLRVCIIKIVVT